MSVVTAAKRCTNLERLQELLGPDYLAAFTAGIQGQDWLQRPHWDLTSIATRVKGNALQISVPCRASCPLEIMYTTQAKFPCRNGTVIGSARD